MAASATVSEEVNIIKEFSLLPLIFETIQALQKTNDPQELTKKINSFRSKVQHCRDLLDKTPGLEISCEEQKELLKKCKAQYQQKWSDQHGTSPCKRSAIELLRKYKNLPVFTEAFIKETM